MSNFYIEKLIISGIGKTDSVIPFKNGLNIIYGPSNTGKTYIVKCIDYLFGSDENPIDETLGYDHIKLEIKTLNGRITLARKLNKNKIEVSSTDISIRSGIYQLKGKYENTLNSIWLRLIGIDEEHLIIKNEHFQKQHLTWRTFIHMFLLSELRIINNKSILLPVTPNANTASISSFLFLAIGNDFNDLTAQEDKKIKEAKKAAVVAYINEELSKLAERKGKLTDNLLLNKSVNLEEEISIFIDEISTKEAAVTEAIKRNQLLLKELADTNERLSECNILFDRYKKLKSQYTSDIQRLSFIVDGEANKDFKQNTTCPFCDGQIVIKSTPNYIEASKSEFKKISLQLKDLEKTITAINTEKLLLEQAATKLLNEKQDLENLVDIELKPQISNLQQKLDQYRAAVRIQNELDIIKQFSTDKVAEIIKVESEEESTLKFKPKEYLERSILDVIDGYLNNLLDSCKFDNFTSVRFDKVDMDVIINGKKKHSYGKGYCAFLNTILSIAFSKYLQSKGKYSVGLLIFDSPILSLKEPDDKISDNMKNSLFKYFTNNLKGIQTIIVENEIPSIDYKNANIIRFTKIKSEGRYGLLEGVFE